MQYQCTLTKGKRQRNMDWGIRLLGRSGTSYEAEITGRSRKKTGAKKKNLPSKFDRYKSAKIGNNKIIKNMYKLDTVCYNGVKL